MNITSHTSKIWNTLIVERLSRKITFSPREGFVIVHDEWSFIIVIHRRQSKETIQFQSKFYTFAYTRERTDRIPRKAATYPGKKI